MKGKIILPILLVLQHNIGLRRPSFCMVAENSGRFGSGLDPLSNGRICIYSRLGLELQQSTTRPGCSEPAVYWSLASNLFTSHWGHRVNKRSTGCMFRILNRRPTEEQWNSLRPNLMAKTYVYTVTCIR